MLSERITFNPAICHGKPTIRNKRYMISAILEYLQGGDAIDEILSTFPDLEREDIMACIEYKDNLFKKVSTIKV